VSAHLLGGRTRGRVLGEQQADKVLGVARDAAPVPVRKVNRVTRDRPAARGPLLLSVRTSEAFHDNILQTLLLATPPPSYATHLEIDPYGTASLVNLVLF